MTAFCPDDYERNWLWLGVDRVGAIASFQTFGIAPMPATVSCSVADAELVDEFVAADLLNRVGACDSRLYDDRAWHASSSSDLFRFFRNYRWGSDLDEQAERDQNQDRMSAMKDGALRVASCGLHIFEIASLFESDSRGYSHVALPVAPLTVNQLPESIRIIVQRTTFAKIEFRNLDLLTEKMISELTV